MTIPLLAALDAVSDVASAKAASLLAVAQSIADRLARGQSVSRQTIKSLMKERFGGSDAFGDWTMRDGYDALEVAQVLAVREPACAWIDPVDPRAILATLEMISRSLPTQSYRTEHQVDLQQFSTPLPLAWLAAFSARMTSADIVLEPSAGTGMLAAHARRIGAELVLNERDPLRAELLGQIFGATVTQYDAEFIHDLLAPETRPSVVLINPPFSRSEGRGRDRHAGARHLRSALGRLAHQGRCVAIMSPAFAPDGTAASGYDAVCNLVPPRVEITITGQPYAKHGTSISVRLIIFDKGWSGPTERVTVGSVGEALTMVLDSPPRLNPSDPEPPAPAAAAQPGRSFLRPARAGGLFRKIEAVQLAGPPALTPMDSEPQPLVYQALETPVAAGEQIGIYVPWRLARIALPKPQPHPDQLVESVAMASILPPKPSYVPILPPCAAAALSEAQIETVIYAGQAFERAPPGQW